MPPLRGVAPKLAVALVAGSVLFAVVRGLRPWLALVPDEVFAGFRLWQPLSYAFIETSPMGVIFGAIIIWSIGGALEQQWGAKRFLLFSLGTTALAGLLTAAVATLLGSVGAALFLPAYAGGTALTGSMWVAYGLLIGPRQTNFWGMPVTGNMLAFIGAGFVFLNAAFSGFQTVVPDALALLFAFFYVKGYGPGALWTRFRSWQLQRELDRRSSHLKVVGGEKRNVRGDSDKYLH
jgi:membrane associated rhomboid family serine protease